MRHDRIHRVALGVWIALLPVSYLLMDSIVWVVFMSHYAILVGHWSAIEAADPNVG